MEFEKNQRIFCDCYGTYYSAKIVSVDEEKGITYYTVHYDGWSKKHDEVYSEAGAQDAFKEFNENPKAFAKLNEKSPKSFKSKKASKNGSTTSKTKSTPKIVSKPSKKSPVKRSKASVSTPKAARNSCVMKVPDSF